MDRREGEWEKKSTKSRNVFYILFVGARRVVEINKPNENETEHREKKTNSQRNTSTVEREKILHTNSHFYLVMLALCLCAKFFLYSFNCSPVCQKYCRTSVTPPPSTSSFCFSYSILGENSNDEHRVPKSVLTPKMLYFQCWKFVCECSRHAQQHQQWYYNSDAHQNTTTLYLSCCMPRTKIYALLSDSKVSFSALQSYSTFGLKVAPFVIFATILCW